MADWSSKASLGELHSPHSLWLTSAYAPFIILSFFFFILLDMEPTALCTGGKCFTTELCHQNHVTLF